MWSKPKRNLERKRLPFAFKRISFLHNMQSTTRYVTILTYYIVIMATREMLFKGSVKFLKDIKRATRVISQSFKGHEEVAASDFLLIKCHNVDLLLLLLLMFCPPKMKFTNTRTRSTQSSRTADPNWEECTLPMQKKVQSRWKNVPECFVLELYWIYMSTPAWWYLCTC